MVGSGDGDGGGGDSTVHEMVLLVIPMLVEFHIHVEALWYRALFVHLAACRGSFNMLASYLGHITL